MFQQCHIKTELMTKHCEICSVTMATSSSISGVSAKPLKKTKESFYLLQAGLTLLQRPLHIRTAWLQRVRQSKSSPINQVRGLLFISSLEDRECTSQTCC